VPETSSPNALLLQPAEIRAALLELIHPDSRIMLRDPLDHEVQVVLIGVDRMTGGFFWRPRKRADLPGGQPDWIGMSTSTAFHFAATGYDGVRMHFRAPRPQIVTFADGSITCFSPLPERLSRVQHRNMFRTALRDCPVHCTAAWMPPSMMLTLHFTVHDISVEGVGLRSTYTIDQLPGRGDLMRGVRLAFGTAGSLTVDLDVRNVSHRTDGAEPAQGTSHLGALITGLDIRNQVWLQQMVWRLEKLNPPASRPVPA